MLSILVWIVFGLLVGMIARALHPGDDPPGCAAAVGIGVAGSFVGGLINWLRGAGTSPLEASGFLMSILGGVLFLMAWRWYTLRTSPSGPRNFFTGKINKG